jgi:hypothetical protein
MVINGAVFFSHERVYYTKNNKYCKTMLSCVFGAYSNMPMIVNKVLSFIYNK